MITWKIRIRLSGKAPIFSRKYDGMSWTWLPEKLILIFTNYQILYTMKMQYFSASSRKYIHRKNYGNLLPIFCRVQKIPLHPYVSLFQTSCLNTSSFKFKMWFSKIVFLQQFLTNIKRFFVSENFYKFTLDLLSDGNISHVTFDAGNFLLNYDIPLIYEFFTKEITSWKVQAKLVFIIVQVQTIRMLK